MGRIPKPIVDQIYNQADILDIVQRFVPNLKRRGIHWVAKSPFNDQDTDPSFYVTPKKGIFKDFSSGEGGNVVNFLMAFEKVDYREALVMLAGMVNIEIPEKATYHKQDPIYEINRYFTNKWHENLLSTPAVLKYLIDDRGLTLPVIRTFQLGWCPKEIQHHPFGQQDVVEADIYRYSNQYQRCYPNFWERVMFPFFDPMGRVTGFTGRVLPHSTQKAKYKNSRNNGIFDKSSALYGLYQNRRDIRHQGELILVEGQMDVLGLHSSGVKHAIGVSGTAFSRKHGRVISQHSDTAYLWFDPDRAGGEGLSRAIRHLLSHNVTPTIVCNSPADPDEIRKQENASEFVAKNSQGYVEYFVGQGKSGNQLQQAKSIRSLCGVIACIPDQILRRGAIRHASDLYGAPEGTIAQEVSRTLKPKTQKPPILDPITQLPEYKLLRLSIHYPGRWKDMLEWIGMEDLSFEDPVLNKLKILLWNEPPNIEGIYQSEAARIYADMATWNPVPWEEEKVKSMCRILRTSKLNKLLKECQNRISEEMKKTEDDREVEPLLELHRLIYNQLMSDE